MKATFWGQAKAGFSGPTRIVLIQRGHNNQPTASQTLRFLQGKEDAGPMAPGARAGGDGRA